MILPQFIFATINPREGRHRILDLMPAPFYIQTLMFDISD